METVLTLRLDLGVPAKRFSQMIQIHNDELEKQVEEGVNQAFDEIAKEGGLVKMIAAQTKDQIYEIVKKNGLGYRFEQMLVDAILKKGGENMEVFADKFSSEILEKMFNSK